MTQPPTDLAEFLRRAMADLLLHGPDLTARQLAVLLICCLESKPQAVSALATRLNLNRDWMFGTLHRLLELGLTGQVDDPGDSRRTLVVARAPGRALVQRLRVAMEKDAAGGAS